MNALVLDLETFALADADRYLEPVAAPANYKNPEAIEKYCAERRVEMLSRCALDPDLCVIVAAGWGYGPAFRVMTATNVHEERQLIEVLWQEIDQAGRTRVLVGFNLLAFDLPVLIRRSQYLGITVPPITLDRYRTPHIDLMERLSFNGKIRTHSLDFYCSRFGIDIPDEHDGADIDALVKAGNWSAIAAHCRCDVERTAALAARLGYLPAPLAAEVF